jgi:hypothetical protein
MIRITILFNVLFLSIALGNLSSQDGSLFMFESLHRSYINPAHILSKNLEISVAGFHADLGAEHAVLNDLFQYESEGQQFNISLRPNVSKLEELNLLRFQTSLNTLDVGFKIGALNLMAGHAVKIRSGIEYTRDLASLVAFGNAPFVGEVLSIGPDVQYLAYNEFYIGLSMGSDGFSYGARVKFLNGIQNYHTERSRIDLFTNPEIYQLTLTTDYIARSSSLLNYNDISDIDYDIRNISLSNISTANPGFGLDLGLMFRTGEKLQWFASALDIGSISWNRDAFRYESNKVLSFEGIDILDYISNDNTIAIADSLERLLDIEKNEENYTTSLVGSYYLGGKYHVSQSLSIGVMAVHENYGSFSATGFSASVMKSFGDVISAGINYHYRDASFTNLGFMGSLKLGPAFGFFTVDNALGIINRRKVNAAGFRVGVALML